MARTPSPAFFRNVTFSQVLKNNPGLTPRVLSMRLRELQREELLQRVVKPRNE